MRLAHSLATVADTSPDQLEDLRRKIDPGWVMQALEATDWLIRAKRDLRWRELRRLGPKDALVELDVSREARRQDPTLPEAGSCERSPISGRASGRKPWSLR